MTTTELAPSPSHVGTAGIQKKRVVFTMGGKGGVGKTAVAIALAEWYEMNHLPVTLLDLDTENKTAGSLRHFYPSAMKVNINTPLGLDSFLECLADEAAPILLADMGAGAGAVANEWFDQMYPDVQEAVVFTAIGVVTEEAASVASVLSWASWLGARAQYVIVKNSVAPGTRCRYWDDTREAREFCAASEPIVLSSEFRVSELEQPARQHGLTLGAVATRATRVAELAKASLVIRAQGYRRRLMAEFDKATELLIP
jgi:hypothetical protein